MPRIVTMRSKDESSREVVSLVLSQDAVCLGPDGEPGCGVTLNSEQARSLAERLYGFADEIDNQEEPGYRNSTRSLTQLASVLVLHDGSQQGHRAFRAGLDLAARALAALELIGIFGIGQPGEPPAAGDYAWQEEWLNRLVEMYTEQAAAEGVSFQSRSITAGDEYALAGLLTRKHDLIVVPHNLIRGTGPHVETLLQVAFGHCESNILVCP
jgi:hypothetical protein